MPETGALPGVAPGVPDTAGRGEVRQELAVNLPLKRTAPKYRDKDFADIFPQYAETESQEIDPRWAALKAIKFNKQ